MTEISRHSCNRAQTVRIWVGVSLLSCSLLTSQAGGTQYLAYEQVGTAIPSSYLTVADLEGDGTDEALVLAGSHGYVYKWDEDHLSLECQLSQTRSWTLGRIGSSDLFGDGHPSIWLSMLQKDVMRFLFYRWPCGPSSAPADSIVIKRARVGGYLDDRGPFPWDVAGHILDGQTTTAKGYSILVGFTAGYSYQPRGIVAFARTPPHSIVWEHRISPCPVLPPPVFWRSDPTGARIVLAGAAFNNARDHGAPEDTVAAVQVIDGTGAALWERPLGGLGTVPHAVLGNLDADGIPEVIVACRQQVQGIGSPTHLTVFSLDDGSVLRDMDTGTSIANLCAADVDLDGKDELLLLSDGGELRLYDSSLSVVSSTNVTGAVLAILTAADVDGSGKPEIYVSAEQGTALSVYDGGLTLVGILRTSGAVIHVVSALHLTRKVRCLAVQSDRGLLLYKARRTNLPPATGAEQQTGVPGVERGIVAAAFLAGLLGAVGVYWTWRRLARGGGAWARTTVTQLKIIRHGERVLDQPSEPLVVLQRWLKSCAQIEEIEEGRGRLKESIRAYESRVAPAVSRVLRTVAFHAPPRMLWRSLTAATRAGKDLRWVLALLEAESPADQLSEACTRAVRAVTELEAGLRQIERVALRDVWADPVAETCAACSLLHERMARDGVALTGIETCGRVGARVFIDPDELRRCLFDLLLNAVEACQEAREPRVGVTIACGERHVVVRIADNGRGVPEEDRDAIFHGKSSKSPPGGAGLSHARQVVEMYSGRALLAESLPWERTVFEVQLCRAPS